MQLRLDKLSRLAVPAFGLALSACSTLQTFDPVLSPPSQFQLDRTVTVEFVAAGTAGERCSERGVSNSSACGSRDLITLPDPCAIPGDTYVRGMCEIAGTRAVKITFVHPDLAPGKCALRGKRDTSEGTVVCKTTDRVFAANPCLDRAGERFAALACHELAHSNGWAADHAGGSFLAQPSFVKARLEAGDVLSPEAVRMALLEKAGEHR